MTDPIDIPPLAGSAIHIWLVAIPEDDDRPTEEDSKAELSLARRLLDTREIERADAFRFEADRARFTRCRSALRRLIGGYLGIAPDEADLAEGAHGKPWLSHPEHALHFNLSHTRGLGVIAVSRTVESGIDVESSLRPIRDRELIPRCFTEREQAHITADETAWQDTFFRYWTAKESLMKATGLGLSLDPRKIDVHLTGNPQEPGSFATTSRRVRAESWMLYEISGHAPYRIALAVPQGTEHEAISVRELPL